MTRPVRLALPLAIAALCWVGVPALTGQSMPSGTWSGEFGTPDGTFPVSFEVAGEGENLSIHLVVEGLPESVAFDPVELEDGVLTVGIPFPNVVVTCELAADDDGSYEGDCLASDGDTGSLKMVPPTDG